MKINFNYFLLILWDLSYINKFIQWIKITRHHQENFKIKIIKQKPNLFKGNPNLPEVNSKEIINPN